MFVSAGFHPHSLCIRSHPLFRSASVTLDVESVSNSIDLLIPKVEMSFSVLSPTFSPVPRTHRLVCIARRGVSRSLQAGWFSSSSLRL